MHPYTQLYMSDGTCITCLYVYVCESTTPRREKEKTPCAELETIHRRPTHLESRSLTTIRPLWVLEWLSQRGWEGEGWTHFHKSYRRNPSLSPNWGRGTRGSLVPPSFLLLPVPVRGSESVKEFFTRQRSEYVLGLVGSDSVRLGELVLSLVV